MHDTYVSKKIALNPQTRTIYFFLTYVDVLFVYIGGFRYNNYLKLLCGEEIKNEISADSVSMFHRDGEKLKWQFQAGILKMMG